GTSIGLYLTFFTFTALGLEGMPRRVVDYLPELMPLNQIATFGAIIIAISQLVLLYNMLHSWLKGRKAEDDPWQLAKYGLRDYD
ncbi:MAG: cytochrome-c oxidase, partial [Thaumarchaeota archaeon]|nr:cytochrome-c oxidase [Nitrososphaerota archaeon]